MFILRRIRELFSRNKYKTSEEGYDLWSANYDQQPGNLMLDLDEEIFSGLLQEISLSGKEVVDVGCGTGRHWEKMLRQKPAKLTGYDVSKGMLDKLRAKYPGAEVFLSKGSLLQETGAASCDLVISTLTIAHIEDVATTLAEWNRVLKQGGGIILTDYHPLLLAKGAKRTFHHEGKTVALVNHIHSVGQIMKIAEQLGWKEIRYRERKIDETIKHYYTQQNAMALYEKFHDVPVIYGIYFKKQG